MPPETYTKNLSHSSQNDCHQEVRGKQVLLSLWRKWSLSTLVGMKKGAAILEASGKFFKNKSKNFLAVMILLAPSLRNRKLTLLRYLHTHPYCCSFTIAKLHSQPRSSSADEIGKANVFQMDNGFLFFCKTGQNFDTGRKIVGIGDHDGKLSKPD